MLPSADQLFKDADLIFQQDLTPAHTAKSTKSLLNDHGVGVLDWPANSPDLNIENLWETPDLNIENLWETPDLNIENLWETPDLNIENLWETPDLNIENLWETPDLNIENLWETPDLNIENLWETPDLNIENLWSIVKRKMRNKRPKNADELKATVKETWTSYHLSSATNWSPPCHAELRQ